MGEIENIRIRERKKIEDARIAIITLGDSSTLPDAKRNKLEQTIRAALTARQEPINQELLDALKAENEALKAELAKRQWQPIESAPKDGTEMLISDGIYIEKGIYQYCKFYVLNNGDYGDGGYGRDYDTSSKYSDYKPPTHWMPLPDAPEVKE